MDGHGSKPAGHCSGTHRPRRPDSERAGRVASGTGCEGAGAGVNAWRERRASKGRLARVPPFRHGLRAGRAVANGVKMGRKPKLTAHQKREAIRRRDRGEESLAEIGRSYNVSGWTISRLDRT